MMKKNESNSAQIKFIARIKLVDLNKVVDTRAAVGSSEHVLAAILATSKQKLHLEEARK